MGASRWLTLWAIISCTGYASSMSLGEKSRLRDEAKDMFFHAFNNYMTHAYPADELKPLSCSGRYRGVDASRGDVDEAMGNFAMTLIDSLDTLPLLGAFEEFSEAVKRVIDEVMFDSDFVVSVFETNIRVVGGLLGAHALAVSLKVKGEVSLQWYDGQLLEKARDLGDRLMPAFETNTGIPYPRVNLLRGMSGHIPSSSSTCTACAGTMLLEFAALSRMTGNTSYERAARKAMDGLWQRRSPHLLVGTTIDVQSGDWKEQDSGVGAGIDSYYEYCMKAFVLLGDAEYLDRFNKHYAAVMRYVRRGNTLVDIHMYNPSNVAQSYIDSLGAFWPGLQVLVGDVPAAIDLFSHMEKVVTRHRFMPEAYTIEGGGFWWHHFLRPEFIESAYFLYQATGDDHYLDVGKALLRNIQEHARVDCGFAAFSDLRTLKHEDRMDSFVLAETFKYLYLLFAEKSDIPVALDDYVFTTEAHLLPLDIALNYSGLEDILNRDIPVEDVCKRRSKGENVFSYSAEFFEKLASAAAPPVPDVPTRCMPVNIGGQSRRLTRLLPQQLNVDNLEHRSLLKEMGISIISQGKGQLQLIHNSQDATTPSDSDEGIAFMQALIQLNAKLQEESADTILVSVEKPESLKQVLNAGSARFGPSLLTDSAAQVSGSLVEVAPLQACAPIVSELSGRIALIERGSCMFIAKVMHAEAAGAIGAIIYDFADSKGGTRHISMTGNGSDVAIPSAFLLRDQVVSLLDAVQRGQDIFVHLQSAREDYGNANHNEGPHKANEEDRSSTGGIEDGGEGMHASGAGSSSSSARDLSEPESIPDASGEHLSDASAGCEVPDDASGQNQPNSNGATEDAGNAFPAVDSSSACAAGDTTATAASAQYSEPSTDNRRSSPAACAANKRPHAADRAAVVSPP